MEHRTDRMIKLLKEHQEGLNMQQLIKELKVKSTKDIGNTIQLLKQKGIFVKQIDGIYKLIRKKPEKIRPEVTHVDAINWLIQNPDGVSLEDLAKHFKTTSKNISNRIWYLNKKGYGITNENGKYYYNKKSLNPKEPKISNIIPAKYHKAFLALSESDQTDCLDMLRKSLYYHKSAISLLESNDDIIAFISSIKGNL